MIMLELLYYIILYFRARFDRSNKGSLHKLFKYDLPHRPGRKEEKNG